MKTMTRRELLIVGTTGAMAMATSGWFLVPPRQQMRATRSDSRLRVVGEGSVIILS